MDPVWLLFFLPLAAAGGWIMAIYDRSSAAKTTELPEAYFKGLSFLLNEEPDKALKVFLEVVEVNDETVEVHMALGNLFRRRGEVERATQIHQNLVARSDLDHSLRSLALFELAQDYFKAGLFDRAENLFQEIREINEYQEQACKFLLQIYDQEKEWQQAIETAKALNQYPNNDYASTIAHFYCELVETAITAGKTQDAELNLELAFQHDPKCVRAVVQSGRLASARGNHANAVAIWRGLEYWAPSALGEVVGHIVNSYKALNDRKSLKQFLQSAVEKTPDPRIIAMLVDMTGQEKGQKAGQKLLLNLVRKYPSLQSVYQLMKNRSQNNPSNNEDNDYSLFAGLLEEVVKMGRDYNCRQCGFQSNALHWQCPGCKGWGTVQRQMGVKLQTSLRNQSGGAN